MTKRLDPIGTYEILSHSEMVQRGILPAALAGRDDLWFLIQNNEALVWTPKRSQISAHASNLGLTIASR